MTPGAIIALGAWGTFCALLAFGVFNEIRSCWRRRREARQVQVLNQAAVSGITITGTASRTVVVCDNEQGLACRCGAENLPDVMCPLCGLTWPVED